MIALVVTTLEILVSLFFAALVIAVAVDFYYVWHHVGRIVAVLDEFLPLMRKSREKMEPLLDALDEK